MREAAAALATVAGRLRIRQHDPEAATRFLDRIVFCLFAISDRNWILDGANVHISMVGFSGHRSAGILPASSNPAGGTPALVRCEAARSSGVKDPGHLDTVGPVRT